MLHHGEPRKQGAWPGRYSSRLVRASGDRERIATLLTDQHTRRGAGVALARKINQDQVARRALSPTAHGFLYPGRVNRRALAVKERRLAVRAQAASLLQERPGMAPGRGVKLRRAGVAQEAPLGARAPGRRVCRNGVTVLRRARLAACIRVWCWPAIAISAIKTAVVRSS